MVDMYVGSNKELKDKVGNTVIITALRAKRPQDFQKARTVKKQLPKGEWISRCFPNKFYAVSENEGKAYGWHEVIVETPDHNKTLSEIPLDEYVESLHILVRRIKSAKKDKKLKCVCIFKNEGILSGASLEHTHTQFVALDFVPEAFKHEEKNYANFRTIEKDGAKNAFYKNASFVAFCPPAPKFNYESWIMPIKDEYRIEDLSEKELRDFGDAILTVIRTLDAMLSYPSYNIVFQTAPFASKKYPLHVRILPRISTFAGFEFSTDVVLNSIFPEQATNDYKANLKKL
jgi:UDPglucose--hexose-1-phosphate uridylyltransferase